MIERVAKLHYEHGLTHQEIADLLGLSRIKVTRLLAEARSTGIVEITVHSETSPFVDLELELVRRYGLRSAWIAPSLPDNAERADAALSRTAAEALSTLVSHDSTVAVTLSSLVRLATEALAPQHLGARFVPVSGSWTGVGDGSSPYEIALRLASSFGGEAYRFPSAMLAPSAAGARALLASDALAETVGVAAGADLLLCGLGGVVDPAGLLFDSLSDAERTELVEHRAVGDIAGRYFDDTGQAIERALDSRIVGLTLQQLRGIPLRLAVLRGHHRLTAAATAFQYGLINAVITDSDTARALLE